MKKTIFIFTLLLFFSPFTVMAATTPTPNPTSEKVAEKLSNQINELKDKIASRVAQLKLVEKKGFIGTVKDASSTQLTILDMAGEERAIDVDEITKFTSSGDDSFGVSDLKKGMKVSVIGLYNKDSERLLARFIDTYTLPLYLSGTFSNVDKENYTVTLAMEDGKTYLVDIESVTKTNNFDKDNNLEKSGFSKIEKGLRAIIIGYADKKEANRMVATRILLFPTLPKNPKVVVVPNAVNPTAAVTSSGSGKKLTPIK